MISFPRQSKEIESLTAQLNAAHNLNNTLAGITSRHRAEIMALREKVLLLGLRPTHEQLTGLREQLDHYKRQTQRLETELEIARVKATPPDMTERRCDCPMCEARGM